MTPSIRAFTLKSLLSYISDCHGLNAYDLSERDIDVKSKADIADAIECYGWAADCYAYLIEPALTSLQAKRQGKSYVHIAGNNGITD